MKRIHVIGRKNHGKTTLIAELLEEMTRRGLKVGTVKHTSHLHRLDRSGSDSHRHRTAGADPAVFWTGDSAAVFLSRVGDAYTKLAPLFADCDLVLVEGDLERSGGIKVEVWRASLGGSCRATDRHDVEPVVSDDEVPVSVPVWPRHDVKGLTDRLLALAAEVPPPPRRCLPG